MINKCQMCGRKQKNSLYPLIFTFSSFSGGCLECTISYYLQSGVLEDDEIDDFINFMMKGG